jgi:heavy metal translocating P-type ATPase
MPVNARNGATRDLSRSIRPVLVGLPALGLALGFAARLTGSADWAPLIWGAATVPVLLVLLVEIASSLRRGDFGLDIVAALSMTAALIFGEELAAVVVALMYSGGQYLENYAERRARREMTALLSRVPRSAMRYRDGTLEEVALEAIAPGDCLLIRRGDIVPVDGTLAGPHAALDQSALTGESMPVDPGPGGPVLSGSTNVGEAFDLVASHRAAESTYAGILRLVEEAQRSKAPMARLADRYALVFLAVTVALAGGAWAWTGDPIRAVAVLVVATPCPLILAVPVAIISGISRAARHGILIKSGGALEGLGRIRGIVLDKTGTLTEGRARIVDTLVSGDMTPVELLRLAASLDQASPHIVARALVAEAQAQGIALVPPSDIAEIAGEGIEGNVDGMRVVVGGPNFVRARIGRPDAFADIGPHRPGAALVAVAVDGEPAGAFLLADELRADTAHLFEELRAMGIARIVLATGDRADVAEFVARGLPFDVVRADLKPDEKVAVVYDERRHGPVMMVGDGVNDAPALAAADVGMAMGARGAAASAEAADVVLLVDRIARVAPAIAISKRARAIALQSVWAGLGLSGAGMIAAAFGYLTPVQGALLQELIDVAVILNALRALADPPRRS